MKALLAFRSICLVTFLGEIHTLVAQRTDTVEVQEPGLQYMVVTRNKNGQSTGPVSYFDADSVLRRTLEFKKGKLHGISKYFYPNGGQWVEMPYKNGVLHGTVRSYHSNGMVEAEKPFRNGKLYGERILKDRTGALVNGDYVEVLPYDSVMVYSTCVNGRPHGVVTITRKGRKVLEGNCSNGLPDGEFVTYDANGKAVRRDLYRKGKFVPVERLK